MVSHMKFYFEIILGHLAILLNGFLMAHHDRDSDQGSHGYKLSAFTTDPSRYPAARL